MIELYRYLYAAGSATPTNIKHIVAQGRGGTGERPLPETREIGVEKCSYLREVYTFREEAEIIE